MEKDLDIGRIKMRVLSDMSSSQPTYQVSQENKVESSSMASQSSPRIDFWRDPAWQSIGVVVTVIFSLLAIAISLKQFQRKSLSYEIVSRDNIVKIADDSIEGELQISYKGKIVKDLYLITIKFFNSGNIEIRPEDYIKPVSLSFGHLSEILGNTVLEQSPNNLGAIFNHDKNEEKICVEPILLNKQDYFIAQVLVTNLQSITIDGRIAGVRKIDEVKTLKLGKGGVYLVLFLGTLLLSIAGNALYTFLKVQFALETTKIALISSLIFLASITIVSGVIVNRLSSIKIKQ